MTEHISLLVTTHYRTRRVATARNQRLVLKYSYKWYCLYLTVSLPPGINQRTSLRRQTRNCPLTFRCAESYPKWQADHKSKGLRVFFQARPNHRKVQI